MRYIENDWRVRKLIQIYESYFNPLKGRTQREGRDYLFHAFKAILLHERFPIRLMDEKLMPVSSGGSFFLIDDARYLIDLIITETLDEKYVVQHIKQIPELDDYDYTDALIILNFGGQAPEWYPFEPEEDLP
jgi:hypothetical protein